MWIFTMRQTNVLTKTELTLALLLAEQKQPNFL